MQELSALRDSSPAEAANITKQLRKEQTKVIIFSRATNNGKWVKSSGVLLLMTFHMCL